MAWKNSPVHIPKEVKTPSCHPPRNTLRMTMNVSTPGAMVRSKVATIKVNNWELDISIKISTRQ